MSSLRLMWIEPAWVRLMTFVEKYCLGKATVALMLLLLVAAAAPRVFAQEKTWGDPGTPLVYTMENTGANTPAPNFPDFAHLPMVEESAFQFLLLAEITATFRLKSMPEKLSRRQLSKSDSLRYSICRSYGKARSTDS